MNGYRLDLVVKFLVVHIKMPKLNVNMLALFFLFKDIEKMSRKLYNNRDKKGEHCYGKWKKKEYWMQKKAQYL